MANLLSRELCTTCGKGTGIFKCQGCLKIFCTKHSVEHRQKLHIELDELIEKQEKHFQELTKENDRFDTIINGIKKWENEWIEKVKQVAKDAQLEIENASQSIKEMLEEKISSIKKQLIQAKEDDDFIEIDLTTWSTALEELKQDVLTHSQAIPLSDNPNTMLEQRMIDRTPILSSDDDEDFVSVTGSIIETLDKISHFSMETARTEDNIVRGILINSLSKMVSCYLDRQCSTPTNDETSTDDQSDQSENLQCNATVMQSRPIRGYRGGFRGTRATVTHNYKQSQCDLNTYSPWDQLNYHASTDRGRGSHRPTKRRQRSRHKNCDQGE
ncbi:unnamed protein product [Adineta steineri]|uniref:B box-type domain-containing protein n=1 Tax=Adineta steineri TaxID=433720 RepID=A0A814T1D3_9BILA|nr:unnamed protein product [Adineta steineri]CAF1462913.1 unnamed protein product [Adineta steineri]